MKRSLSKLLEESRRKGLPLWSFTVYNLELANAVLSVAETLGIPVVLLISEKAAQSRFGERLIDMLVALCAGSSAHCCVELDHAKDLVVIQAALARGVNAVMADGARLEYAGNVTFVKTVKEISRRYGADVEAELGLVTGAEDSLRPGDDGTLTEVDEAIRFVEETNIDCLAVSIGNVHGHYEGVFELNWNRLREIGKSIETPLALHGVSGLGDEELRTAVRVGATKFNVNTELREVYFQETRLLLDRYVETLDVLGIATDLTERLEGVVDQKIQTFENLPELSPQYKSSKLK
jgi:tagatose 1,6-diphosphate aldolase GatY/KbaY